MLIAVIDVGGTSIKYGVANDQGDILYDDSMPTKAYLGGDEVMYKVLNICKKLRKDYDIQGISVSSAGQIDNVNGKVIYATDNIPNFTGTSIAKIVEDHTGLPVKVENDVNCTALGEYWKGAAMNAENFLCVTIGTGIGGALFLNGQLYTGSQFSAGEFGHITLYPNGKACTCGNRGCYETYASSAALENKIAEAFGYSIDLKQFFKRTKDNDPVCVEIFKQWTEDLTTGLASLVHIFNPELIIVGGGISAQGSFLLQAIRSSLMGKLLPNHQRSLEIKLAENENKANLLGAAKHYLLSKSG